MIVIRTHWGLANRLFFFAYCMALGEATGHGVVSLALTEGADYFVGAQGGTFCRWPSSSFGRFRWPRWWHEEAVKWALRYHTHALKVPIFRGTIIEINTAKSMDYRLDAPEFVAQLRKYPLIYISGWVSLEHILLPNAATVRAFFTPVTKIRDLVQKTIEQARKESEILVGIHIRRGDFLNHEKGRYYFAFYHYLEVMHRMAALHPGRRVAFLICSDEKQDADAFLPLRITLGPGTEIGDLYSLAECDYIISPNSSYSLWAAFYGKRRYWCMKEPDSLPTLEDFVIPESSFAGLHPEA